MKKEDLENRLIDFSVISYHICREINNSQLGMHLSQQLTRSSVSPALNYGEAQGAESQKDFIHKMRICLKEIELFVEQGFEFFFWTISFLQNGT